VALTANEFNSLRILFKVRPEFKANSTTTLSNLTPFYAPGSHSTKVHMGRLVDWVMESVSMQEEDSGFGATISPSKP